MSRHIVFETPDKQLVLGFDRPLRAFFGQLYGRDRDRVIAGHPTRYGLGIQPFVVTEAQAMEAVDCLLAWARARGLPADSCPAMGEQLLTEWLDELLA